VLGAIASCFEPPDGSPPEHGGSPRAAGEGGVPRPVSS
jgi:hypothetical protein